MSKKPQKNERKLEVLDPEIKEEFVGDNSISEFSDGLDIIRHMVAIHDKNSPDIPPDIVLFQSDENDRDYSSSMYDLAFMVRNFIRDKKTADKLSNFFRSKIVINACLKRNQYQNPILSGAFSRISEKSDDSLLDTLKQKIGINEK